MHKRVTAAVLTIGLITGVGISGATSASASAGFTGSYVVHAPVSVGPGVPACTIIKIYGVIGSVFIPLKGFQAIFGIIPILTCH